MRHVRIADGLRVRFPSRGAEFDEGVEIGVLAALMACGSSPLLVEISPASLEQARALAEAMGYRLLEQPGAGLMTLTLREPAAKPALKLIRCRETA
jgi:hypothetical protein